MVCLAGFVDHALCLLRVAERRGWEDNTYREYGGRAAKAGLARAGHRFRPSKCAALPFRIAAWRVARDSKRDRPAAGLDRSHCRDTVRHDADTLWRHTRR